MGVLFLFGKYPNIRLREFALIIALICGIEAFSIIVNNLDYALILRRFIWRKEHFDNVAGEIACLCPSLPFLLYLAKDKDLAGAIGKIATVLSIIAILVSGSRTGMVSVFVTLLLFLLFQRIKNKRYKFLWLAAAVLLPVALVFGLYFLRPDSADGRILILKVLLQKIKYIPTCGYGIHGFREKYMDFQADYFRHNASDDCSMLADNTLFPFNEYFHFYFCFGIIGLIVLTLLVLLFFYGYRRYRGNAKRIILMSMVSICVLSLFSYPFNYPYIYVILAIGYCVVVRPLITPLFSRRICICLSFVLLPIGSYLTMHSYRRIQAVSLWREASANKDLLLYSKVYEVLKDNPYFLYNYSSTLLNSGQIDLSEDIAMQCRQKMSTYNLELLLGEINQEKGDYGLAEQHYVNASYMCPCRFIPLYSLMRLYSVTGEKDKEKAIASAIIQKPIKVKSIDVSRIRLRARFVLEAESEE